jgi:CRISPR-associated protein (TIGR02710 family)
MEVSCHNLLVCTVGGSPDPVVKSILTWKPGKVLFITSKQTESQPDTILRAYAETSGSPLIPAQYEVTLVSNAEDLIGCVTTIRGLERDVMGWIRRSGGNYAVVVDFTAGTKCMTAALALVSQRWPCHYSYVGGTRRTKEGVGIVEQGTEHVVHCANPWDTLGYQAVEDFVVLFDQGAFAAAVDVASRTKARVDDPTRKREMSTLEQLARAFDEWDRFDHKRCKSALDNVSKGQNDLRVVLGDDAAQRLDGALQKLARHIDELVVTASPSRHHVIDLLANAQRRNREGRTDDAIARLYRAIEAMAQVVLKEHHQIESTEAVPLDRVPETMREQLGGKARSGVVTLGLQDAYVLLEGLNDPVGQRFKEEKLDATTSPLTARNRSILAHGFELVSQKVFDKLWASALKLAEVSESDLPFFPFLGKSPTRD